MPAAVLEEEECPPSVAGLSFLEQGRLAASSRVFIIVIIKNTFNFRLKLCTPGWIAA